MTVSLILLEALGSVICAISVCFFLYTYHLSPLAILAPACAIARGDWLVYQVIRWAASGPTNFGAPLVLRGGK